ncbi:MAG: hypothetical protein J7621_16445 [Niastella sp.]|nr:hypothetical protein [Niastella sp.]
MQKKSKQVNFIIRSLIGAPKISGSNGAGGCDPDGKDKIEDEKTGCLSASALIFSASGIASPFYQERTGTFECSC